MIITSLKGFKFARNGVKKTKIAIIEAIAENTTSLFVSHLTIPFKSPPF
jgi:hypothetical protein